MHLQKRKDPYTGEEFIPKRNNQKFASRANQIAFNNVKAQKRRTKEAPVLKALRMNRTILEKTLGSKREIIKSKDFLEGAGFNFNYWSQSAIIDSKPCQIIHEFCLFKNEGDLFTIKRIK